MMTNVHLMHLIVKKKIILITFGVINDLNAPVFVVQIFIQIHINILEGKWTLPMRNSKRTFIWMYIKAMIDRSTETQIQNLHCFNHMHTLSIAKVQVMSSHYFKKSEEGRVSKVTTGITCSTNGMST